MSTTLLNLFIMLAYWNDNVSNIICNVQCYENKRKYLTMYLYICISYRCFSHFYIFASIYIPLITAAVCFKYFGFCTCPLMNKFIDIFSSPERNSNGMGNPFFFLMLLIINKLGKCFKIKGSQFRMNLHVFFFFFYIKQ